ncbi:uncharacterized protein LOC117182622 [Belonocnema kinseyi]|uniref:uncharacterized protein LOC117182622 n=1 Tax=Belonocnema kinseyi TaxID=2817044 RepID=UPI00143DB815|nr:uncharacterized protein LOC117182622 [Belonocnema kinseyi]
MKNNSPSEWGKAIQIALNKTGDGEIINMLYAESLIEEIEDRRQEPAKGEFRRKLPVIPRLTHADEINACLKSLPLWRNVENVQLKVNIRVQMLQDPPAETFSKQLLDIGDGKVAVHENTECIKLPTDFCIIINSQNALIDQIFPDIDTQYLNHEWLTERAIFAAKNVDVKDLNFKIQHLLPGDLVSYKSIDTVCDTNEAVNYPAKFLNSLDLPGTLPHHLRLKVGYPVILLRNLNPPQLCNDTRKYCTFRINVCETMPYYSKKGAM